ncbi:BTAD domain-containing putative transcriptional regulator [Salinispora fenicalii]|uniref:BTAD domain-containing putative transcriptional regulator n=1 Tax=Salinispora fenicalii TaxID=1137263 RepID=UPI00048991EC|nr:BTAD domain-containing putative transcriptional regulator [Salinispora fenicalii]
MSRIEIGPHIQILGPIQATIRGNVIDLGPPKQRAILALLALRAGRHVPLDDVIATLWAGQSPTRATNLVHTYVARLRQVLEPDTPRHQRTNVIASVPGGYRLAVGVGQLDLHAFRTEVREAASLHERGQPTGAFARFGESLGRWRDPQVGELAALLIEQDDIRPLRQEFLAAALNYVGLGLELGRAEAVLPVAEQLALTEPLNERVQARLLQTLARIGQRARAIERYAEVRGRLRLDLGVDPGPELSAAYREVLDAKLASSPTHRRNPAHAPPWRGAAPLIDELTGRSADLAAINDLLDGYRLVSLTGPAGVGKSALGLAVAEQQRGRHADGVAVVDLTNVRTGAALERAVMAVVASRPRRTTEAPVPLVRQLEDRRLLLVIDNAELVTDAAADLADELLRGCPGLTVLLTSRELLGMRYEAVYPVRPLRTDPEPGSTAPPPAQQLFARRATQVQPSFQLDEPTLPGVTTVCRALDGLPLAIELAAACLRTQRLDALVEIVTDPLHWLQPPRRGVPSHHRSLHAAVHRSIELLDTAELRCFTGLGAMPADFDLTAAAGAGAGAGAGTGADAALIGDPRAVRVLLDRLVDKSVLEVRHGPGGRTYHMLGTVHALARQLFQEGGCVGAPPSTGCTCGCHLGA